MKCRRVLLMALLTVCVIVSVSFDVSQSGYAAALDVRVFLNGQHIVFPDQQPVIIQGRTVVPIRFIVEALGAMVEWHESTMTVVLRSEGQEILLRIGSQLVFYNGELREIDVPAQLVGGRTMVPLRFVSEVLGFKVDWDEQARSVLMASVPEEEPSPVESKPEPLEAGELFKRVSPAVVLVEILDANDNLEGVGSGFIISSSGRIVTNYHVIEEAHSIRITTADRSMFWVKAISTYDVSRDVAILEVDAVDLPVIEWGDSSLIASGDRVFAIGNPLGLQNTISEGLVSNSSRIVLAQEYIQISAPISPGSSGGVLVNSFGQVIGVTTAGFAEGQNLNLAIPINDVKSIIKQADEANIGLVPIEVESVSLDLRFAELLVESSLQLVATVSPAHASNAAVNWSSSDPSVLSVDSTGRVVASSVGSANVTVTTVDGGKQAVCTITVRPRSQNGPLHLNPHGNTSGNIGNQGLVAQAGEWIYYSRLSGQGGLYRTRIDGTERTLLTSHFAASINVLDEWVYYQSLGDSSRIYKIRIDGTDLTKLNDDISYNITVVGDWIYYSNRSDDHKVYRIRTDGTERTRLNNEMSVNVVVVDDWVYYSHNGLRKMRTDGTSRSLVTSDQCWYINIIGEWLYYKNTSDGNRIYKTKNDGTGRAAIGSDSANYINVVGDWIYYQNQSDGNTLYRMLTDGTGRQRLTTNSGFFVNVAGDWVYYNGGSTSGALCRVGKDGTGQELFY